jgi:hypothetical protein
MFDLLTVGVSLHAVTDGKDTPLPTDHAGSWLQISVTSLYAETLYWDCPDGLLCVLARMSLHAMQPPDTPWPQAALCTINKGVDWRTVTASSVHHAGVQHNAVFTDQSCLYLA